MNDGTLAHGTLAHGTLAHGTLAHGTTNANYRHLSRKACKKTQMKSQYSSKIYNYDRRVRTPCPEAGNKPYITSALDKGQHLRNVCLIFLIFE